MEVAIVGLPACFQGRFQGFEATNANHAVAKNLAAPEREIAFAKSDTIKAGFRFHTPDIAGLNPAVKRV